MKKYYYEQLIFAMNFRLRIMAILCMVFLVSPTNFVSANSDYTDMTGISVTDQEAENSSFQQNPVKGTVRDAATGETLIGVTVLVKGTIVGTLTDLNGQFTVNIPQREAVLALSFIGYKTQEITVTQGANIVVALELEIELISEVVVVGYGSQRKASVVGAITQIGTESLVRSGVTNVTNAISGKLSGVLTIQQSGEPGADDSEIIIRGLSSWNGSEPLVLVDGVERDFKDLDPNEINTVSVLKDASATAVFGAKGANGVIIVTTKRGIQGKPQLNFSGSAGVENITDLPDHIDSHTTMSMWNVAKMNEQTFIELISDTALEEYRNPSSRLNSLIYPDVNWFDMCANSFAPTSNANLNIRGGNEFVRYFGSLGHTYQSDFFKNYSEEYLDSRYWYHRLNYRVNLDFNLTPSTLFSFNMGGDIGIKNQPSSSVWRNLYGAPTAMFPAYYPDWVLEEVPDPDYPDDSGVRLAQSFGSFHANPYSTIASGSFNRYITSTLFTDIIIDQKVDFILKGLSIKGKASLSTYYRNRSLGATYAYPQYMFYPNKIGVEGENPWLRENASDEVYVLPPVSLSAGGLESGYYRDMYYEGGINFNRSFGNHNATALLLVNREQKNVGTDFPYYNQGIVGRLTYDYKSKYLLEINVGYTGSERFSPKNRYGFFPSGAIGYVISEEDFFKSAVPWMNKLKLRYSEGLVGSDIAANRWLYISDFYIQNGYINEDKGANTTAQWEEAHKKDFGIEFGIFNNLFSGTIDLFDEQRDKMLLEPRTVTFIVGNTFKEINSGKFKKHGIEVELEFNKTTSRNFNYFVRTIVGWNENRVVFKDDLPYAYEYQKSAGKPIDVNFDGIEMSGTGYFTTVDDIQINPSATSLTNLVTGDYMYLDYNCDGIIDQKDKHPIEGSYYPPLTYSLTSGFSYKNFDFHVMFQGNEGKYVFYNYTFEWEFSKGDYRVHESQLDYWTPLNQTANHATLHDGYTSLMNVGWAGGSNDQGYTLGIPDRTWRDASYLRFKEIYLGYTLSSRFLQNVAGISNVQAYITGNNLFTWTPLIEGDPERKDFQYGFYPQMRNIKVGLSFSF